MPMGQQLDAYDMKFTVDQLRGVRNDATVSPEEVARRLENGVDISYGDLGMRVEARQMAQARAYVAELDPEQRRRSMISVTAALARSVPRVLKGRASKKVNDEAYGDLLLWQALKEVAAS